MPTKPTPGPPALNPLDVQHAVRSLLRIAVAWSKSLISINDESHRRYTGFLRNFVEMVRDFERGSETIFEADGKIFAEADARYATLRREIEEVLRSRKDRGVVSDGPSTEDLDDLLAALKRGGRSDVSRERLSSALQSLLQGKRAGTTPSGETRDWVTVAGGQKHGPGEILHALDPELPSDRKGYDLLEVRLKLNEQARFRRWFRDASEDQLVEYVLCIFRFHPETFDRIQADLLPDDAPNERVFVGSGALFSPDIASHEELREALRAPRIFPADKEEG